jgi:hypothetical protein
MVPHRSRAFLPAKSVFTAEEYGEGNKEKSIYFSVFAVYWNF